MDLHGAGEERARLRRLTLEYRQYRPRAGGPPQASGAAARVGGSTGPTAAGGLASSRKATDQPLVVSSPSCWRKVLDYEKLTPEERKKAHRERCYKLVSLLHLRGDCFVYAAMKVVPGNAHECPVLYELVEQFVQRVGQWRDEAAHPGSGVHRWEEHQPVQNRVGHSMCLSR